MSEPLEKLLRPKEVASILGLKPPCIYRMLRTGELPSVTVKTGKRKAFLRVRPSALEKWLLEREYVPSSPQNTGPAAWFK